MQNQIQMQKEWAGNLKYFDIQVNGYGGVDFNGDALDPQLLDEVCDRLASERVEGILATVITDALPAMEARMRRLAACIRQSAKTRRMIHGIHLEGPFLNPMAGFRGAHPEDAIVPADLSAMKRLLDAGDGLVRLVTLAPERDAGFQMTRMLSAQKIVVAAGHTDATREELKGAIDAGLTMFTHLGNGCPAVLDRHDNIIQRALSLRDHLWLCFIADGAHLPFFVLKNYLDLAGTDRCVVVTDAIVAAGMGPGRYRFGRWDLDIGSDGVARPFRKTHLAGSTVTMEKSHRNLISELRLSESEAQKLLRDNPRIALGLNDRQ